jgi:hypothetical protein
LSKTDGCWLLAELHLINEQLYKWHG